MSGMRTLVILHSETAAGPPQHVFPWLDSLAARSSIEAVVPAHGSTADLYRTIGATTELGFEPLTCPRGLRELRRFPARFVAEVQAFRLCLRRARPDLVVVASAVLPAALVAARLERVRSVVYAGELLDKGTTGRGRALANAVLRRLTGELADAIVGCS